MSDHGIHDAVRQDGAATPLDPFPPSLVPPRRRAQVALVGVVFMVAVVALARLGFWDREPSPLGVEIRNPTTLVLRTTCADAVSARVAESADSVRIDRISGTVIDGDCLGGLEIELSAPLGDRLIFVAGRHWNRAGASCPYGEFGPGGSDVPQECR